MARVLIIDTEDDIRESLRLVLELEQGAYTVIDTSDPEFALQVLLTAPEAVVVLFDAGIPRTYNDDLAALLNTTDKRLLRHAYICMTTSLDQMFPELHAVLLARSVPIIAKPFEIDLLLATVAQAAGTLVTPRRSRR
jgi:DNA-binding NtrC family response regulator